MSRHLCIFEFKEAHVREKFITLWLRSKSFFHTYRDTGRSGRILKPLEVSLNRCASESYQSTSAIREIVHVYGEECLLRFYHDDRTHKLSSKYSESLKALAVEPQSLGMTIVPCLHYYIIAGVCN